MGGGVYIRNQSEKFWIKRDGERRNIQIYRERERQTDRQTDRQTERARERERERERERAFHGINP